MKNILIVVFCLSSVAIAKTQSVGIGTESPDSSAILDLTNPDHKGLLIPSMSTEQKNAIEDPADGLLVYQLDSIPGFYSYDGASWQRVGRGGNAWVETDSTVYTSKIVGIGNSNPDTSAILDLSNTDNKGVLIPSMTSADKDAIDDPADGLLMYQTDSITGFYFFDDIAWGRIGGGGNAWEETDSTVYTSKFVGINTDQPYNHLDVHGNMGITQSTILTETPPTPAQTKTMVDDTFIFYFSWDSTGRFYDPGGPNGQYAANLNAGCQISFSSHALAYEITIEEIDLGQGDSLIIRRDASSGEILYSFGNQNSVTGIFQINETGLYFQFKSDGDNSTLGDGISILFKRIYPDTASVESREYVGSSLVYDSQTGSIRGGLIDFRHVMGNNSFNYGEKNEASGRASTTFGKYNLSSGQFSMTVGYENFSDGESSFAVGKENLSIGDWSFSAGSECTAEANGSFAIGSGTKARGLWSFSQGKTTINNGYASIVVGLYNAPILTSPQLDGATDATPLFIIGNGTGDSERTNAMVVRYDGHVGLGTNNPRITLHVAKGTDAGLDDDDGFLVTGNVNGVNLLMDDNEIMARNNGAAADLFLQHNGGRVLIGTGGPGNLFDVNGIAGKPGGGSWSGLSDSRLKEHIRPYTDGLQSLLNIRPVAYHYAPFSGYDSAPEYVGIIAQELQSVAPYMVTVSDKVYPDGNTDYLQVDNSAMTYMLINAVKELHAEIENLKSEIQELRKAK